MHEGFANKTAAYGFAMIRQKLPFIHPARSCWQCGPFRWRDRV